MHQVLAHTSGQGLQPWDKSLKPKQQNSWFPLSCGCPVDVLEALHSPHHNAGAHCTHGGSTWHCWAKQWNLSFLNALLNAPNKGGHGDHLCQGWGLPTWEWALWLQKKQHLHWERRLGVFIPWWLCICTGMMALMYHLILSQLHGMPWSWSGWCTRDDSVLRLLCPFLAGFLENEMEDNVEVVKGEKYPETPLPREMIDMEVQNWEWTQESVVHQAVCVLCSVEPSLKGRVWCLRLAQLSLPKEVLPKLLPQHLG